jgi:ribonuclease P protein component
MVPLMNQTAKSKIIPFSSGTVSIVPERDPLSARDARLRKHADYQRVYQATRKQFSPSMTWFLAARPAESDGMRSGVAQSGPRVGLTAGKVLGKAHERNRIKRRMREVIRRQLHELPDGVDLIMHPRRSVMTMEFVKLESEILRIFRQAAAQVRQATASKAPNSGSVSAIATRPNES